MSFWEGLNMASQAAALSLVDTLRKGGMEAIGFDKPQQGMDAGYASFSPGNIANRLDMKPEPEPMLRMPT